METRHFVQKVLRDYPQKIEICIISDMHLAADILTKSNPPLLGVDVQLCHTGHVTAVVFATSRRVIRVPIPLHRVSKHHELATILTGEEIGLVGIEMERLALHLWRDTGCHVRATDLSTSLKNKKFSWPSELLGKTCKNYDVYGVDSLWQVDTKEKVELACRRAWITAWFVLPLISYPWLIVISLSSASPRGSWRLPEKV